MATLICLGVGCGAELGPGDLLCPHCGSPRPRSSLLAGRRGPAREQGYVQPEAAASPAGVSSPPGAAIASPSEPAGSSCDHHDSPRGAVICPACGDPIRPAGLSEQTTLRRFRLVTPWGDHPLAASETEVGRDVGPLAGNLKGHLTISRRHASLRVTSSGRLHVVDHGSVNGTFKNDHRLEPNVPVELRDGDTVSFSTKLSITVREV